MNHSADQYPTIISFAIGAQYYHDGAERLVAQCEALGLNHSVEHIEAVEDLDWAQICRLKIQFYRKKLLELDTPVMWIDADTELLNRPETLRNSNADFSAMLRTGYLNSFDPYVSARMWAPQVLYFGNTPMAARFLDHLADVEAKTAGPVTDDYVFQEAWSSFEEQMSVLLLPPTVQSRTIEASGPSTWILHGDSGNVQDFKDKVLQHGTLKNRGGILTVIAQDLMKTGDFAGAEQLLRTAEAYGFESIERVRRLAESIRRQGRVDEAKAVIKNFHLAHPLNGDGKIAYARQLMKEQKFTSAERLFSEVEASGDPRLSGLATSLLFDLAQERKAKRLKLEPRDRTRVWWMKQPYPGNLGDILNPYIVEKLTGIPPRLAPRGKGMLAIGSVIKFAHDGCDVWGTGTPRLGDVLNPNAKYHAVRGPLTRQLVLDSGGECPEVYGDPALLMPLLYNPEVKKKYRLGVIRHVRHRGLGEIADGVRDLNLLRVGYEEIEKFIDELLECEMVVSTSLHGIILAHAYGIPARWAEFSDTALKIQGDGTKYIDYLRSVQLPDQTPLDLSQFSVLDESLIEHIDPDCAITFDARALLDAFPGGLPFK
ncbi:polysaccharide pyruvyl transferase family protein [Arthrobacter sp. 131MFCol6.1]|jgi:hypothetical protein|uniref:polysaccharide pyruvyl transferase family protein n=1 Tax=Arthrobacter sp. 131MFCol6.1 TaxID=1157944 RepID=UPI00036DFF16|nr:polysaccharide pyruvyl transferase family protein [Arthrobacter sp. 131MFCol6.1]